MAAVFIVATLCCPILSASRFTAGRRRVLHFEPVVAAALAVRRGLVLRHYPSCRRRAHHEEPIRTRRLEVNVTSNERRGDIGIATEVPAPDGGAEPGRPAPADRGRADGRHGETR
jgi:hypothetical protein